MSDYAWAILTKLRQIGRDQAGGNVTEIASDGSTHKIVVGNVFKLGRTKRGLRLYLKTSTGKQRVASWRMLQSVVTEVLTHIYRSNYKEGTRVKRSA